MAYKRLRESSIFLKLATVVCGLATILQILGVALPYWYYKDASTDSGFVRITLVVHYGLWRSCSNFLNHYACFSIDITGSWFSAVQALEILGIIGLGATLLGLIIGVFVTGNKAFRILTTVAGSVTAAFILIGVIVFGANTREVDGLHVSFGLCTTAGILICTAVVLKTVDLSRAAPPRGHHAQAASNSYAGQIIAYPSYPVQGQLTDNAHNLGTMGQMTFTEQSRY